MASLFIIGNGFDISHGLKTSYEDFRQYLIKNFRAVDKDEITIPEAKWMPDGSTCADENEVVSFLLYIISNAEGFGCKWSDLEKSLGNIEWADCFDDLNYVIDHNDDNSLWHNAYNHEDRAQSLIYPMQQILVLFSNWIESIKITKKVPTNKLFAGIANFDADFFLTFNYTKTLEVLYQAKNVCHIHGIQGDTIIFGHGNNAVDSDEYPLDMAGAEDYIYQIEKMLRKDTDKAMANGAWFFHALSQGLIEKIFSFGFSFSEVDRVYIKNLLDSIPSKKITWYLHSYDLHKHSTFKQIIDECGFQGSFATFNA